jgi:prepilin-type N-terminal cleavage/methylation domain-containing protein/prepilin-type processing-associated H-X9-DG protein
MPRGDSPASRRAFTIVELLVVIAIVGLLASLLFPAVQAARESARRTQCVSRLRQLGVSLHDYHTLHRAFPAGSNNGWSWHARILPQLEQHNLYEQYDFRHNPLAEPNSFRLDSTVRLFRCPSDPYSGTIHASPGLDGVRFAHTNFLGSLAAGASRGMFPYRRGLRIAGVIDGTSQTLFVGERGIVFDGVNTHGWWTWGAATTITTTQPFQLGSYEDPAAILHWWSHHPSGANFLFVDGSVRFLAYTTDGQVFAALGTRDSRDIARL